MAKINVKYLLIVAVVFSGGYFAYLLSYPKKDTKLKSQIIDHLVKLKENEIFDVTKITDFEWDKMYMVYSDSGLNKYTLEEITGINHYGIGASKLRFYFLFKGELVKFFDCQLFEEPAIWIYGCSREFHLEEVDYQFAQFRVQKKQENGHKWFTMTAECT